MTKDYEIWKCQTLIKMLLKRKDNPERALDIYPKSTYEQANKNIEKSKQKTINQFVKKNQKK